ncbi:hypothetical protein NDU88_000453 [Pleurodeles waltl]|uniref:Lamina-associated polypeptide 2 alpha C-terminal domain-containing protein n=1 Tax=Pleurodeles waltl TaxID=8319 RepID=A0AAV7UQ19_PLEWA|nr:hypothetical protein NDU88_000453 [Pleurodeles waltl]
MPRFTAKLYPLQDMLKDLPDSIPNDCFVASLVMFTSVVEDANIRDSVDEKVDVALKKVYSGAPLSLRARIYRTYVVQSLISDTKSLYRALDESSDCSEVLEYIDHQVEFLSDVPFDIVRVSAVSGGACVVARHNLVLRDWEIDADQRSSALQMPFQGSVLFGTQLKEKLHKLCKEKKNPSSLKSLPGDRQPSKLKSSLHQPFNGSLFAPRGRFQPDGAVKGN